MTKVVDIKSVVREYNETRTRLIILDYDGTLVPFDPDPKLTTPGEHVISLLNELAADNRNSVILISGRDKEYLEAHFKRVSITLVAEHGGYYKGVQEDWNTMFLRSMSWVPQALTALQALTFQYEGSYIEQKTFSVAWHYRKIADRIFEADKQQILAALRGLPEYGYFVICDSEFTIELRTPGIDKGTFISRWVGRKYFDFILSLGDSETDEDIFKLFGNDAYTIRIGNVKGSSANFYIESQQEVVPFLRSLLNDNKPSYNRLEAIKATRKYTST